MNNEFLKYNTAIKHWRSMGWYIDFVAIAESGMVTIGLIKDKCGLSYMLRGMSADDLANAFNTRMGHDKVPA